MSFEETATVASILAVLRERTGADFSRYRTATVHRRILNRMISTGAGSLETYLGLIESSREEVTQLLARMAIKVSRFYRHAPSMDVVRSQVLPRLAERRGSRELRIWSAGCGYGEEAYTLAMLLDEAGLPGRVEATDIDSAAIARARAAYYPIESTAELPPALADKYLERFTDASGERVRVCPALRRRVSFSVQDLTRGATPGERGFDLVSCRNVLIYFQRDLRDEVFALLHAAALRDGFLLLGEAEWPCADLAGSLENLERGTRVFALGVDRAMKRCDAT